MKIVWDERKRLLNLENRDLDFSDIGVDFFAASTVVSAKQDRFKAVGEFKGGIVAVIFKPLGSEAISIVSMRRASRKERNIHDQLKTKASPPHG